MTMQDIERTGKSHPVTPDDELSRLDKEGQSYVADRLRKLMFGEAGLSRGDAIGIALQELRDKRQRENRKPDFYEDQSLGARRDVPAHMDMGVLAPDERLEIFHDTPARAADIDHMVKVARGVAESARTNLARLRTITSQPDEAVSLVEQ